MFPFAKFFHIRQVSDKDQQVYFADQDGASKDIGSNYRESIAYSAFLANTPHEDQDISFSTFVQQYREQEARKQSR